jgi:DNA polymerase (family X)
MNFKEPNNQEIAVVLDDIADLLEVQHANPHKIRAYRTGAKYVQERQDPIAKIVFSGDGQALQTLPNIGESLATIIEEYVKTGKSQLLNRLQGEVAPEDIFEQIPGIGEELAEHIVKTLNIKTLEELEQAAHDGRLAKVEGFGERRVEAVQMTLAGMLSGFARRRVQQIMPKEKTPVSPRPVIDNVLKVDEEYRQKVSNNELKKISPKRFNPKNEAWLPIYHTEKEGWFFTALFSNTARAHDLHKTHDWVIIFYEKNGFEGQSTVVTETNGPLEGRRVVRGREPECMNFYFM